MMRWSGSRLAPAPVDPDRQWTPEELANIRAAARTEALGRIITALLIITMPVWFFPAMLCIGIKEFGIDALRDIPRSLKFVAKGERFPTLGAFAVWRNPTLLRKPGPIVRREPLSQMEWD